MLRSSDLRGRRKSGAKNSSRGPISLGVFRFECREGGEDAERGVVIGRRSQDATEDDEEEGKGVRWGRARGFAGGMPMMRLMVQNLYWKTSEPIPVYRYKYRYFHML